MRSVRSANYLQVDNEIRRIFTEKGIIIRPSREAYEDFRWTRDYFEQKPKEGYFIWFKKQIDYPLITCIAISSPKVSQEPMNLVVIEENVEAEINSVCYAVNKDLHGIHVGRSKIVLKENSRLKMKHFHKWGKGDTVRSSLEFSVGKGAKLSHTYKCVEVPSKLETETDTFLESHSSVNLETVVLAKCGDVYIQDSTFLNGKGSSGISRVRLIGDEESRIVAHSKMIANDVGIGHLDCMGLLLAGNSSINAIPELINRNRNASLTHEAFVGKISEENLNYLRSRGLTEAEAIDLIVTGFLGEEAPFILEGRVVPSKLHM